MSREAPPPVWPAFVVAAHGLAQIAFGWVLRRIDRRLCQISNDSHLPLPKEKQ